MARLFLRGLALVSLIAWLSMGSQILLLVGSHGLLPIAPLLDEARRQHVAMRTAPTLFWWSASDTMLIGACALGAASALYGLLYASRVWLIVSLPLYLSVCIAAQDFCGFQWDLLLLETSFVALFLDPQRPTLAALWMPRLLLVKLYVESGIAKAQSPIGDWFSGSAMVSYFETAPLPMPLARWLHALPLGVLHWMAWLTLFIELVVPLCVFGSRPLRRFAFIVLTGFQLMNVVTANYGFFVPLTLLLHLFLLDDDALPSWLGRADAEPPSRRARITSTIALAVWGSLSLVEGLLTFTAIEWAPLLALHDVYAPLRVVNAYHLFGAVTTERIEPTFFVRVGQTWTELALHDKPGPVERSLPIVQPHQPRVDFQLWFNGLRAGDRLPRYVVNLEDALCSEPSRVASLFTTAPPEHADAIQIRYARYHFTSPKEKVLWTRAWIHSRPEHLCGDDVEETTRR
ncbi:MAG: lipase maturation factor family protein [Polyangia bacterium]